MSSLGDTVINPDLPSVHLRPTHGISCLRSILHVLIVDEGKAPAPATVTVQHNIHLLHRSKLAKLGLKFPLCSVETQPKDAKTLAWVWIFPVAQMPAPG